MTRGSLQIDPIIEFVDSPHIIERLISSYPRFITSPKDNMDFDGSKLCEEFDRIA